MIKALFIDRDGVINKDPGGWTKTGYVANQEDFHFIPGTLEALKILKDKKIKVIVASNQGGVNKGFYTNEELSKVNSIMLKEIKASGGAVEEVFYCIHRDEDNCECRKPKPGMLKTAASKYGVDPKTTYFVGDKNIDVMAAKRAGFNSILVLSGKASCAAVESWAPEEKPDYIFANLLEAVKWLTK